MDMKVEAKKKNLKFRFVFLIHTFLISSKVDIVIKLASVLLGIYRKKKNQIYYSDANVKILSVRSYPVDSFRFRHRRSLYDTCLGNGPKEQ